MKLVWNTFFNQLRCFKPRHCCHTYFVRCAEPQQAFVSHCLAVWPSQLMVPS